MFDRYCRSCDVLHQDPLLPSDAFERREEWLKHFRQKQRERVEREKQRGATEIAHYDFLEAQADERVNEAAAELASARLQECKLLCEIRLLKLEIEQRLDRVDQEQEEALESVLVRCAAARRGEELEEQVWDAATAAQAEEEMHASLAGSALALGL